MLVDISNAWLPDDRDEMRQCKPCLVTFWGDKIIEDKRGYLSHNPEIPSGERSSILNKCLASELGTCKPCNVQRCKVSD